MNLRSCWLAFGVLLLGGTITLAAAAPYLVYQGTITQSADITQGESGFISGTINAHPGGFHKLSATAQREITAALKADDETSTSAFYLIVDEQNVANYTFVIFDPTNAGAIVRSIVSSDLPPGGALQNLITGFTFPTKGGVGILRVGIVRSTGTDPVTGQPASLLLQGFGTGALNTTSNAQIAPKQAAVTFFTLVNGVKGAQETSPAFPAIVSATGSSYMPTITGSALFGYYFDDAAAQSLGGSSTKGSFTLAINPTLTQLANNGGRIASSAKNVGLVLPISASTAVAYKAWAKSLLAIAYPSGN